MGESLYLCDELIMNIERMRDYDERLQVKADISDALCAITLAEDEVCSGRLKELLHTAKDVITSYHFIIDSMAIDEPKIDER